MCRPLQASLGVYAFTTHGLLLDGLASIRRDSASKITEVPYFLYNETDRGVRPWSVSRSTPLYKERRHQILVRIREIFKMLRLLRPLKRLGLPPWLHSARRARRGCYNGQEEPQPSRTRSQLARGPGGAGLYLRLPAPRRECASGPEQVILRQGSGESQGCC